MPVRIAFALVMIFGLGGAAAADCVQTLSYCAQRCDQRMKPETPERPQCGQTCVTQYQSCRQIEQIQSNSIFQTPGGGGMTLQPAPR
jgi:hypothetical protein